MAKWINVKDIAGSAKFYAGAAIKIIPTLRGLEKGNFIHKNGLVYLVFDNALDRSYFNCVCLSAGEEGKRDLPPRARGKLRAWKRDKTDV